MVFTPAAPARPLGFPRRSRRAHRAVGGHHPLKRPRRALCHPGGAHSTWTHQDPERRVGVTRYHPTLTAYQTWRFTGNLLAVGLPNGDLVEYLVDGMGRRVGK